MIELNAFGKDYGDFTAVESIDLKIEAGETFGFIGPNGAGKSTTIRFLATLLHASRGTGEVAGCDVKSDPIGVRQAIGYMPDHFGVYDGMRVWEFLDFFAVAYRIGKTQRKQIIGNVLELLDLGHKRNDFVNGLSRGMKQRLCLAKTLVHDPPVLILDEPASGLDPLASTELSSTLKSLAKKGTAVLMASHDIFRVRETCDRIGILKNGSLIDQMDTSKVTTNELEKIYIDYMRG